MSPKTLMTAAEFANSGPETDGFELVRGELTAMPPACGRHGEVCVNVTAILHAYKKARGKGCLLANDTGFITESDPDTVRGIDVAFFADPPWSGPAPNRYFTEPPDVAAEVRSEGQPWKELLDKANEYLQMARMVWIADPATRRLTVFEPDREPITYAAENQFDAGEILPGLQFSVAEIFE